MEISRLISKLETIRESYGEIEIEDIKMINFGEYSNIRFENSGTDEPISIESQ